MEPGTPTTTEGRSRDPIARRDEWLDPTYTLRGHLLKVGATAAVIVALGAWLARGAELWHWLAVPAFWLVANVFEAAIHRWPMHRRMVPRMLYDNHTRIHHFAYEAEHLEIRHTRDLYLVMMPWYTLLVVFAMASPIAAAAVLVGGWPLAGIFLIASVGYFLLYELIHTLHHLQRPTLARLGLADAKWLAALRAHHHHHHQMRHMSHTNFNVTFPLGDLVLGTYWRDR